MSRHTSHEDLRRSTPTAVVDDPATTGALTRITGRAVPYGTPADIGPFVETVEPGAFRASLATTPRIPLLTYHDSYTDPIGVATSWEERRDGLHGTWTLDASERAREVGRLVKAGMLNFLSIRFQPQSVRWSVADDGREHARVVRGRLIEVSLVSTPAYAEATVTGIRAADDSVLALARQLGAPLLTAAITGTPAQARSAAGLVRVLVDEYGTAAADELEALAGATTDTGLAVSLACSASALREADPAAVRQAHHAYWRARTDNLRPPGQRAPAPGPAGRGSRRRR